MRKLISILTAVLLTATLWAQSPGKMSYQSVIRNSDDMLVANQTVGMQISILQGSLTGTSVYTETQTPTTNANGLVSLEIGDGTVVSGNFATIDWANGPYFIKTETDPNGGTNYTIIGTSQLLSVPYALQTNEVDPNVPQGTQVGQMQYWNGTEWVNIPVGADGSSLQLINGVPTWAGGTAITVPGAPVIGTATAGDAQASVPYTAPESNGGSPILSYTATSNPGGFTGTLNREGSGTIIVTGLTNGTTYTFTVTATNENGTGAASAVSNPVIPSTEAIPSVTNPTTGEVWMDRNLGASRVALNSSDSEAFGDLYQWGRGTDGHQKRTSGLTEVLSESDSPGHGDFILSGEEPYDWRTTQNDNLWQGVNGANNPCPSGYRVPTQAEWAEERATWPTQDAQGAFDSELKLTMAGRRDNFQGAIFGNGTSGNYYSSTVDGEISIGLYFNPNFYMWSNSKRAMARAIRCIKD